MWIIKLTKLVNIFSIILLSNKFCFAKKSYISNFLMSLDFILIPVCIIAILLLFNRENIYIETVKKLNKKIFKINVRFLKL